MSERKKQVVIDSEKTNYALDNFLKKAVIEHEFLIKKKILEERYMRKYSWDYSDEDFNKLNLELNQLEEILNGLNLLISAMKE